MDTISNWDRKALNRVLSTGLTLIKQLMLYLNSASSNYETQEMLTQMILSSFRIALLILSKADSASRQPEPVGPAAIPKKRWVLPTGTNQPNDDGYSWRKYAMEIGAKYPRHYYICRYRHDQYCKATKQTQRPDDDDDDDDDPTVLNITYIGSHTCGQVSHSVPPSASPEKQEPKENNNHHQQQQTNETLFNFRANLRINTEELNYKTFLMFVVVLFVLCACLLVWC